MDVKIDIEAQSKVHNKKLFNGKKCTGILSLITILILTLQKIYNSANFSSFVSVASPYPENIISTYNLSSLILLNALETNYAGQWLKDYTQSNQLAGTNLEMVNYTLSKYQEFGLSDAFIDEYTSYISYPLDNSLSLIQNYSRVVYKPSLIEDKIEEDPNSLNPVPAFLGYAANGNVTAQFVYCNYGTYQDFQQLEDMGVDLKGKIAIVKYGLIYRGLKIKFAQDHDMAAVLLYSDPIDDGDVTVQNGFKPYPNGFARNPSAIQRGSALFLSSGPGDPTTPGYALKPGEDGERVDPYNTIPKIPALPISYKEVTPILQKLKGYGPKINQWNTLIDGYDLSIGPNPQYTLNLYSNQDFNITTMNNIMGKIKGYDDSKFILIGNHHDSWTPAAADPHSGSATMLEIIRAFNDLVETGWKPKISIVFASWDGEEYGLIGSTEFAEYYAQQLKAKCVAYINTDVSTIGNILTMHSSPLLNDVLLETTKELPYPNSSITLYDHFMEKAGGKIGTLGSGSDYTVFLEHLGIPSVDLGFKNDLKNSSVYQYHSIYDSYTWMEKFGDPGFVYHNLMAKLMSLITLHLADEPVLHLRTNDYATALHQYFKDLDIPTEWLEKPKHHPHPPHGKPHHGKPHHDKPPHEKPHHDKPPYEKPHHDKTHEKHHPHELKPRGCHDKEFHVPGHHTPSLKKLVKQVNKKLKKLESKTQDFDEYLESLVKLFEDWDSLSYFERIKLYFKTKGANSVLQFYERHLLDHKGLNNRPWFKHVVYASGRYTGYKGQELPGLAEAIEDGDVKDFTERLERFSSLLDTLLRMG